MQNITRLERVQRDLTEGVKSELGNRLYQVLLYGSYARGDYDEESDMDIMVIADVPREELSKYRSAIDSVADRTGLANDILLSVYLMDRETIYGKRDVLPFFNAVLTEGKVLYAS